MTDVDTQEAKPKRKRIERPILEGQLAYDVGGVAKLSNFSVKHIRRQISAKKLLARRSGRKVIVEAEEVKRWLSAMPKVGEAAAA